MSRRWSKLQTRLYNLMDKSVDMQIHCALYEMNSNDGWHGNKLPRYWVTIGKNIVFDYPKNFVGTKVGEIQHYPYITDIEDISNLIESYIQRPVEDILTPFEKDKWGITNILRVCDRRVGKRSLRKLRDVTTDDVLLGVIDKRLGELAV